LDILLMDALSPDAHAWLAERYRVFDATYAKGDVSGLDTAMAKARGMVLPGDFKVTQDFLATAPALEVFGRLRGGTSNTDLSACQRAGVTVLNTSRANVHSTVEYMMAALLTLHRPSLWDGLRGACVPGSDAAQPGAEAVTRVGQEMYRSVVGLVGLGPVAMAMAPVLHALGVRMVGYDPAVHSSSSIWQKLNIYPLPLPGVLSTADAVGVHMIYATRFHHFVNEHLLKHVKRGQVWVSTSRSMLFEPKALSVALQDGRIKACLLDSYETDMAGLPADLLSLRNFFLTPRLGSQTTQAKEKASWYLAHRIDGALGAENGLADRPDSMPTMPAGYGSDTDEDESAIAAEEAELKKAGRI
jgi:phosphoglycerate dehydrogenase-like enzyme